MKKALAVVMIAALCLTTVISYGGYFDKDDTTDSGILVRAETFEDIRLALKESGNFDRDDYRTGFSALKLYGVMEDASGMDMGVMPESVFNTFVDVEESASVGTGSFSQTNVQVEGVDEADVIKTDGEYLYIAAEECIYIVKLIDSEGGLELVTKMYLDEYSRTSNIFIDGDRLIAYGYRWVPRVNVSDDVVGGAVDNEDSEIILFDSSLSKISTDIARVDEGIWFSDKAMSFVKIYDTSDIENPELIQDFAIDGDIRTARKAGNFVYILANDYVNHNINIEKVTPDEVMPYYTDSNVEDGNEIMLPVEDVYICPVNDAVSFTTLAVLDISGRFPAEIQSFMGSISEFYMNDESAFLAFSEWNWEDGTRKTNLVALNIDGMKVAYRAEGSVPGGLLNQFSMDEYDGYFRIATTPNDNSAGSSIYVLNKALNVVGSINGIAKGEQIYSVRFMGDRGYVVTFETMDPFFTIDLSDPTNPYIAGELKLPGYSNYLHQIDKDTVLGIGRDTQETYVKNPDGTETVVGFVQGGIKLSLFDISDFANPVEKDSFVIGSEAAWADALHNHKAIVFDRANGLVGFCLNDHSYYSGWYEPAAKGAYMFDISGDEIEIDGIMEAEEINYSTLTDSKWNPVNHMERFCYAGDNYYYIQGGEVRAFDRDTYEEVDALSL